MHWILNINYVHLSVFDAYKSSSDRLCCCLAVSPNWSCFLEALSLIGDWSSALLTPSVLGVPSQLVTLAARLNCRIGVFISLKNEQRDDQQKKRKVCGHNANSVKREFDPALAQRDQTVLRGKTRLARSRIRNRLKVLNNRWWDFLDKRKQIWFKLEKNWLKPLTGYN